MQKLSSKVAGGSVNMDVKVTKYYNMSWSCAECGEKVMYLWHEGWVRFGWPVDQEYCKWAGGLHLNARHSNEEYAGRGRGDIKNCFGMPQLSPHHGQCSGLFPGSYSQEDRLHSRQNRPQVVAMSLLGTWSQSVCQQCGPEWRRIYYSGIECLKVQLWLLLRWCDAKERAEYTGISSPFVVLLGVWRSCGVSSETTAWTTVGDGSSLMKF